MSTATAPAVNFVEVFRNDVSLVRCHFSEHDVPYPFVITCPDGKLLWGPGLTEITDQEAQANTLPEIVADKVVLKHAHGEIEELLCQDALTNAETL